jgi:hypothetical protein
MLSLNNASAASGLKWWRYIRRPFGVVPPSVCRMFGGKMVAMSWPSLGDEAVYRVCKSVDAC